MFSNTSAELSLNTPSRCITAIRNDKRQHRFIVGTCAVATPGSNGGMNTQIPGTQGLQHSHHDYLQSHSHLYPDRGGDDHVDGDIDGSGRFGDVSGSVNAMMGMSNANPLYLLRYHEEMNELAVDAQLMFPVDEGNHEDNSSGEVWTCSSCPFDKRLVVTCRGSGQANNATETAIWRIPEDAFKEDDIDFYPDHNDDDDFGIGGAGAPDRSGLDDRNNMHKPLEKVMTLDLDSSERVSDMQWNPTCFPDADALDMYGDDDDDEFGDSGAGSDIGADTGLSSGGGANFLTVQGGRREVCVTTWDMQMGDTNNSSCSAMKLDRIVLPISERGGRTMHIPTPPKASWDPHHPNLCAVTVGTGIAILDLRCSGSGSGSAQVAHGMKSCHRMSVTDVDYNPNKLHVLTSSGQDGLVKFWDLRFTATSSYDSINHDDDDHDHDLGGTDTSRINLWQRHTPLKILRGGHTHWTTNVQYNSFHDQLLLSGGTDGMMNLWRISSISSAPLLDLGGNNNSVVDDFASAISPSPSGALTDEDDDDVPKIAISYDDEEVAGGNDDGGNDDDMVSNNGSEGTDGGNAPDVRVTKMEMREAIYDLAWSAADPWVYVTLGFDGNVVLNHVSSKEKYKILL